MIEQGKINYGKRIDNATIKRGLRELNPDINFDLGGRIGKWHPSINRLEGVFFRGEHVTSLDRGPSVPEFNVMRGYTVGKAPFQTKSWVPEHVGWRHTFKKLVDHDIPGVTWESICLKFGIERKYFLGNAPGIYEVA